MAFSQRAPWLAVSSFSSLRGLLATQLARPCTQIAAKTAAEPAIPVPIPHYPAGHRAYASTSNHIAENLRSPRTAASSTSLSSSSSPTPSSQLTLAQKLVRGTESSFYLTVIGLGLAGTVAVSYLLYGALLAPLSPSRQFNAAMSRIRADRELVDLLGGAPVQGHGEQTASRRAFARPFASQRFEDRGGARHLVMQFWVEGAGRDGRARRAGRAMVHVVQEKDAGWGKWEYEDLYVDVEGKHRVSLERKTTRPALPTPKGSFRFAGISWKR